MQSLPAKYVWRSEIIRTILNLLIAALVLLLSSRSIQAGQALEPVHENQGQQVAKVSIDVNSADGGNPGLFEGAEATVNFSVNETKTRTPISGLKPLAWIVQNDGNENTNTDKCQTLIHRQLHHGHLANQPVVNLNSFLVLTLNQDNTISVIDPQVAWSKTKLQTIIELPGRGDAWLLDPERARLFVTLPGQGGLAVIDTQAWRILKTMKLGSQVGKPSSALMLAGGRLWVSLGDEPEVYAVDINNLSLTAQIPVKAGQHRFAFAGDQHTMFITNSAAKVVSVINTDKLTLIKEFQPPDNSIEILANPFNHLLYSFAKNAKAINIIDPIKLEMRSALPVAAGISQLRFGNDGRFGIAINQDNSLASLIDADKGKVIAATEVTGKPNQVIFTKHYAYISGLVSAQYSVFDLTQVQKGILAPAMVEAGQNPPVTDSGSFGQNDMIAESPDGHGAFLLNGLDRKLYYYMEGMMAASGTLDNGGHAASGVLVADKSLNEKSPGQYVTNFKLPVSGLYDMLFFADQPHLMACYPLKVFEDKGQEAKLINVKVENEKILIKSGHTVEIKFRIEDSHSKPIPGINDAHVLIVDNQGHRQSQHWASYDSGLYKVNQRFMFSGYYTALIKIPSRGVGYKRSSSIDIEVQP